MGGEGGEEAPGENADVYGVNQHESQGSFEDGETSVAELQRQVLHLTRAVNELLKGNDKLSKDLASKKGRIEKLEHERKALARRSEGAAANPAPSPTSGSDDSQQKLQGALHQLAEKEREVMALRTEMQERGGTALRTQAELERLIQANEAAGAQAAQAGELLQREVANSASLKEALRQLETEIQELRSEQLQKAGAGEQASAEMARLQGRVQQLELEKAAAAASVEALGGGPGGGRAPESSMAGEPDRGVGSPPVANAGIERALASKEEEAASLADQLRDERALIQSLQQRLAAFQRRSLEDSSDTESSDSGRAAESGRAPHQELRQLREAKQRAEQEMAALRSFLEQTQEDNRMRGELIENLQNHIAELKGALDDERAALKEKSAREGDRYRDELESLKGQLLAAEAQLVTANASRNDAILYADSLGADIEELRHEGEEAKLEAGRSAARQSALEAQIRNMSAVVSAAKQHEAELLREHDRLRAACGVMEGKAAEHQDEVVFLQERLAAAATESETAAAEVSRLEAEVAALAPPPYSELTMYERVQVLLRSEWFQQVGRVMLENFVALAGTLSFVPPFSHYCPVSVKIAAALAGVCVLISWVRVLGGYEPPRPPISGSMRKSGAARRREAPALGIAVQDLNLMTPDASPAETPDRPRARRSVTFNPLCDETPEPETPRGRGVRDGDASFQATPRSAASSTGGMAELSWTALDTDAEGSPGPSGSKASMLFQSPVRPGPALRRRWAGAGACTSEAPRSGGKSPASIAPDLAWEVASAANAELAEKVHELAEARGQAEMWQKSVQSLMQELADKQAALEERAREAETAARELEDARGRAAELESALREHEQESEEHLGALVSTAAGDAAYEALALKCGRREAELGEARQEASGLHRRLGALQMKLRTTEERLSNLSNSQVALGLDVESLAKELAARSESLREESRRGEAARARCAELEAELSGREERSGDWDAARARLDAQAADLKAAHRDLRLQEEALERARADAKGARAEVQAREGRISELEMTAAAVRREEGERRRETEERGAGELRRVRAEAAAAVGELEELRAAHRALAVSKEGLLDLLRTAEERIAALEDDAKSLSEAARSAASDAERATVGAKERGRAERNRLEAALVAASNRAEAAERELSEAREAAVAAADTAAEHAADLEARLAESKRELGDLIRNYEGQLEAQGEEMRALSAALSTAKAQASELRHGLKRRGKELDERRVEGQALARALEARTAELEAIGAAQSSMRQDAEVQSLEVQSAHAEVQSMEVESVDAEVQAANAEVQSVDAEVQSMVELVSPETVRQLEAEVHRLRSEQLLKAVDGEQAAAEVARLQGRVEQLEHEKAEAATAAAAQPPPPPPSPPRLRTGEEPQAGGAFDAGFAARPVVNPPSAPALPQGVAYTGELGLRAGATPASLSPSAEDRLAEEGFSFARLEQKLRTAPGEALLLSNAGAAPPRAAGHKRSASGGAVEDDADAALSVRLRSVEAEAFQMQERIQRLLNESNEPLPSPVEGPEPGRE